jgi:hypothetical protein
MYRPLQDKDRKHAILPGTREHLDSYKISSFKKFLQFPGIIYRNLWRQGIVHYELLSEGKTVNKEMCPDILRHLMDAVRGKCPEKWRTNSWFPSWHCASTLVSLGHGFLGKEQCDNNATFPLWVQLIFTFSLDWNHNWRYRCLCVANDITKNATDELQRFSQNGFHECSQHHYTHRQKCIVVQGTILKEM